MYYEMTGIVDKLVTLSVSEKGDMQVVEKYDKPYMYYDTIPIYRLE